MSNAGPELTALQAHKSWLIRAALVLLVTVVTDGAIAPFMRRPVLWAVLIASTLPLSMIVFVLFPILRQESDDTPHQRPTTRP
jgi:hypothetical protein